MSTNHFEDNIELKINISNGKISSMGKDKH